MSRHELAHPFPRNPELSMQVGDRWPEVVLDLVGEDVREGCNGLAKPGLGDPDLLDQEVDVHPDVVIEGEAEELGEGAEYLGQLLSGHVSPDQQVLHHRAEVQVDAKAQQVWVRADNPPDLLAVDPYLIPKVLDRRLEVVLQGVRHDLWMQFEDPAHLFDRDSDLHQPLEHRAHLIVHAAGEDGGVCQHKLPQVLCLDLHLVPEEPDNLRCHCPVIGGQEARRGLKNLHYLLVLELQVFHVERNPGLQVVLHIQGEDGREAAAQGGDLGGFDAQFTLQKVDDSP
mmetsp:Transcript_375/g.823  ORF Transcript_375/g.823 Transcript_375/m.823 type:complete len:284 (+) Transcript_375:818-1669(+)